MIVRGHRLVISTLAAAIAIAVIVFVPTEAEATPNWMLGPVLGKLPAELTAKAEKTLSLSTEILGIKTTFSCEKLSLDSALLEAEGKSAGTLLFNGCKTFLNGTLNNECEPFVGSEKGVIASNALKGQLILHEGVTLDQLMPATGETFATILLTKTCPIGTKIPIIGTFYAKDVNGKFEAEEEAHVLEVGPLTELWSISKTAEHKATTEGSVKLSLSGANLGHAWSGLGSKPDWMLGPVLGKLPAELTAKAEKTLSLSTEILGIKTTFSCEKLSLDSALLEAEGKSAGTLLFNGCKTFLNGTLNNECEPFVGSEKGVIASNALKGQLILHEGVTLDQLMPATGETFATILLTKTCPIGTKIPIIGTFYAKDVNGKFEAEEEAHVLEVGPLTELWSISKTAEHKATTEGSVKLSLSGANLGHAWSGLGSKPDWMLGPVLGKLPAELTAKAEKTLSLSTEILGIKTTFSCEKLSLDSALLEAEGKSSGTLLFNGCKTFLNGTLNNECEPFVGSEKGVIASNALKGQLILHEGVTLDQLMPATGETFATILLTKTCPIGTKIPIIGTFYAKDSNGKFETEEEAHVLATGPLTELWSFKKTAENKATTEGSVKLSLSGPNLGHAWSGLGT